MTLTQPVAVENRACLDLLEIYLRSDSALVITGRGFPREGRLNEGLLLPLFPASVVVFLEQMGDDGSDL